MQGMQKSNRVGLFLMVVLMLVGCAPQPLVPTATATVAATATASPVPEVTDPATPEPLVETYVETSPGGTLELVFSLQDGAPFYALNFAGRPLLVPSRLGFVFKDVAPLNQALTVAAVEHSSFDETWMQPWGEVAEIRNHYNELRVELIEVTPLPRQMTVVFRLYDDGLGFRYELPEQPNLHDFQIMDEQTEFAFVGDHRTWSVPAYADNRYEYLYSEAPLSAWPGRAVHTPLTLETSAGLVLSIHEANLTDYASMTLLGSEDNTLQCDLVPWSDGVKVKASTPHQTPWRTIQVAEQAAGLITSHLILNLNEPNRLEDVTWIEPGKYVGIWWGMHIGTYSWGSGELHGATTANAKRYIDFAAEHGFSGVLIEGWNEGWDGDWARYGKRFSFTQPYADFDLEALAAYAAEKGVQIIGHHETGAAVTNYENQMEDAFALYQDLGITRVKTGYVGQGQNIKRYDENGNMVGLEWHHGQHMVQHYRKVVETAARYHIMLDVHEPIKDTGIRRTYPNMMTREGARGQEYNAWDGEGGNPPEHTVILPFTRMLAGPFDFTPGIFDLLLEDTRPNNRINTTLAKQLALYVVIYSPLQMAADLPENYEGHPALPFVVAVPADWQDTRVLHAQIGDFVTLARLDRNSDAWYLGSITDESPRTLEAALDFLDPQRVYVAEIYADAATADWQRNPLSLDISSLLVDSETVLTLRLAPGGGQAVCIRPATDEDVATLQTYQP